MTLNERWQALCILIALVEKQQTLNQLFSKHETLTPLTKNLCFGVCRHFFALEAIAYKLVKKKPDPDLWLILLIGLYQLKFLDKPNYAVVYETVALVDKLKKSWAKGLINAVLRRYCREHEAIILTLQQTELFQFSHPNWLVKKIKQDWLQWQTILTANNSPPPMSLRVNNQQTTREAYLNTLYSKGITATPHHLSSVGIRLDEPCDVGTLPYFQNGWVSVQDESAQLAAQLLDLQPGLRVLDACAAPGGKTCHIIETEPALEDCISLDVDEKRLPRVHENLKRLGLEATVLQGDALNPGGWWDGRLFDRILLDAPCSALGVIRRHPDIKVLRTLEDVQAITLIQAQLLKQMWALLKPGGLMLYATCSILKQENEDQIQNFQRATTDCHVVPIKQPIGICNQWGWQLLPGDLDNDGFFYSILRKHVSIL